MKFTFNCGGMITIMESLKYFLLVLGSVIIAFFLVTATSIGMSVALCVAEIVLVLLTLPKGRKNRRKL